MPGSAAGIVSAGLLGFSRAVGETMIVVMAAGQAANLTANPLETVTTVTVQIVTLITGDTEADTAGPPAFALGFTLFFITLVLNMIALRIVNRYREAYE
jgi:phosphate transport system permease protein